VLPKSVPGIRVGEMTCGFGDDLPESVLEDGRQQRAPGREMAVQGGVPQAGPAGDVIQGCIEAAVGELGLGGADQRGAVASRIGAERPGHHHRASYG